MIRRGDDELVNVPFPICPKVPLPQVQTSPFLSSTKVCPLAPVLPPIETWDTGPGRGTWTGTALFAVVPFPSCPDAL